ncbi:MAG: major facilitator superfamily 1 [Verrucomicrobiales bacterium]|nr:major facilitator superfamily 1 [Verrucomicrobiales bacterium]
MPRIEAEPASTPVHAGRTASGRYKWAVVFMLWFICFFNYADRQAIFSIFPKLKDEFGFDKVQLGLIASAFMWVYALGAPFAGFIADRFPRRHLILGGCLFWSGVTVLTGWCGKLWHFVSIRALEGLGETFYYPASMSLLSDYHDSRTRSRALSFHQSSVYIGTIAGSWLGAWIAEKHGWRTGFYIFGIAGAILALALYRFLNEPQRSVLPPEAPARAPFALTYKTILQNPLALCLMAVFIGANFVATIFLAWTPTFLVEKFGFKLASAGLSGTVFIHLASALSVPIAGLLADRLARKHAGGRMIVQAAGLVVGAVFIAIVGTTKNVTILIGAMVCFGICKGFYDSNIFASLFDVIDPRARGSAAGIMNTAGWGGGALGPLAVGWVSKHGRHATEMENMSEAIAFGGLIYLLGAVALLFAIIYCAKRTRGVKN